MQRLSINLQRSGSHLHRKLIDDGNYLSRIIHINPTKQELLKNVWDWKYSSFTAYCTNKPSKKSLELGLEWFGGVSEFLRINKNMKNE